MMRVARKSEECKVKIGEKKNRTGRCNKYLWVMISIVMGVWRKG